MARAGIQIVNPNTGAIVIDERFRGVALLPSTSNALLVAYSGNSAYAFGYPPSTPPASGEAALIVKDASGNVCFDSRLRYANIVDTFDVPRGVNGSTGNQPITDTLLTRTYPAGRAYAVAMMTGGWAIAWQAISGGAIASYLFTSTIDSQVSGNTVSIVRTTTREFVDAAARSNWPNAPAWRFLVLDVTGMPASSSSSTLSAPYLSISKTSAPVNETITLSWTAATRNPSAGPVTYTVHWTRASDGGEGNLDPTTALSITTGGSVATTYTYVVTAKDSQGLSAQSNAVQIVRTSAVQPITNVAVTPTSVSGSVNSSGTAYATSSNVTVTWNGGGNAGVTWSLVSGTQLYTPNGASGAFGGQIPPGVTYSAVYKATVSDGATSGSANVNVSLSNTYSAPSVLPTPTVSVSPSTVTDPAAATISWNAVARTPTANGTVTYTLYYRQNGGAWNTLNKGTATSHNTGSTAGLGGNSFDYQILASDNGGSSGYSNLVTLTINKPATGVSNVRTTPTNFGVTDPNGTNVASKLLSAACTAVAWDGDQNATVKWTYLSGTQLSGIPTASNGTGSFSHTVLRGQTVSATYRCNVYGTSSSGYSDHTVTLTLGPIS